jgi:hypothetical protein
MSATRDQHVVPNSKGGWDVRVSGASRASRAFATKDDAVRYARILAQNAKSGLYIHAKDGTIKGKSSYNDPAPPKDSHSKKHSYSGKEVYSSKG